MSVICGLLAVIGIFGTYYFLFRNAPTGYEDETGFHFGEPEQ